LLRDYLKIQMATNIMIDPSIDIFKKILLLIVRIKMKEKLFKFL